MNPAKLENLVRELGYNHIRVVHNADDTNIMICCPWHGERNPSAGISAKKEIGGCFACDKTFFTLADLVSKTKEISIPAAQDWLEEKFNVSKREHERKSNRRRYDDNVCGQGDESEDTLDKRVELPYFKLAPFKSGKSVHDYILRRGFSKETCRDLQFGWDETKSRITIPIFWEDGTLCGLIGRSIVEAKLKDGTPNPVYVKLYGNEDKYHVYPPMKKSHIMYPLHLAGKVVRECKEVNLVEGSLDSAWMRQLGFTNTLSILGAKISKEQVILLKEMGISRINLLLDNDKAGFDGLEKAYKLMKRDFLLYRVTYPQGKKDPQELTADEIKLMLAERTLYGRKQLQKIQ